MPRSLYIYLALFLAFLGLLALVFEWLLIPRVALSFGIMGYAFFRFARKEVEASRTYLFNYLTFNYFKEYSTLSIRRVDWAEEFIALNQARIKE